MTTPSPEGHHPSDPDARWAETSSAVSFDKPTAAAPTPLPFDPYRFGPPEHPIPPEYAPPGYVPPPSPVQAPPMQSYPPPYFTQQPYPHGAPPLPPYAQRTTNGKAVAALVLGILSIVFCVTSFFDLFLIIPAIILGSIALNESKRPGGTGHGMALSGFVCAIIGAVFAIAITVWLYPKVARCVNDYPQGSSEYNTCIRDIVS